MYSVLSRTFMHENTFHKEVNAYYKCINMHTPITHSCQCQTCREIVWGKVLNSKWVFTSPIFAILVKIKKKIKVKKFISKWNIT